MAQSGSITYSEGGVLDRFPWYVQLLVLLGVILLVLFVVHWFMIRPMLVKADQDRADAEVLRQQNQEADTIAQNIEAYQKTLDGLNAQLDAFKVRLPEEREISRIFENAKSMITSSGLKLDQFQTITKDKEVAKQYYTEVPLKVRVSGKYPAVQELFRRLSSYERIVNVTDIALEASKDEEQARGASTTGAFTLTAFYISDANRKNLESAGEPPAEEAEDPKKKKKPGGKPKPAAKPPAEGK